MDSNFFRPTIIVPKLYLKLEFDTEDQVLFGYRIIFRNNIPLHPIQSDSKEPVSGHSRPAGDYPRPLLGHIDLNILL